MDKYFSARRRNAPTRTCMAFICKSRSRRREFRQSMDYVIRGLQLVRISSCWPTASSISRVRLDTRAVRQIYRCTHVAYWSITAKMFGRMGGRMGATVWTDGCMMDVRFDVSFGGIMFAPCTYAAHSAHQHAVHPPHTHADPSRHWAEKASTQRSTSD